LLTIDPFGWDEFGLAVAYSDNPAGVVKESVVESTQHNHVVDIGATAVFPFQNMV